MTTERDLLITEVALRDGSHAIAHQYTVEQVAKVAKRSAKRASPISKCPTATAWAALPCNTACPIRMKWS